MEKHTCQTCLRNDLCCSTLMVGTYACSDFININNYRFEDEEDEEEDEGKNYINSTYYGL